MEKIRQANELFIVRSVHQRNDAFQLILLLGGDCNQHGEKGRGHPRGRQIHQEGCDGC
jgi:hypothetical protein